MTDVQPKPSSQHLPKPGIDAPLMNTPRQFLPRAAELASEASDSQIPVKQDLLDFFGNHSYSRGRVAAATRGQHITRNVESCQSENARNVKKVGETPFGGRLREAFGGATNTEIARKLNQSNSAITNYMAGRMPPPDTLIEISKFTNCSIHWLLTGDGPKKIEIDLLQAEPSEDNSIILNPSPSVREAIDELASLNGLYPEEQTNQLLLNGLIASIASVGDPHAVRGLLFELAEMLTTSRYHEKASRRKKRRA